MRTVTFDETKWVMVPMEPTPEMVKAGDQKTWVLPSRDCWKAMLAARPSAPTAVEPTAEDSSVVEPRDGYVPCPTCAKNTASDDPSQWCPCAPRENKIRLQQKAMSDLTKLAQLAEQHALSYASPHHFTLSVVGLRSIIEAEFARAVEQATAARLGVKMGDV